MAVPIEQMRLPGVGEPRLRVLPTPDAATVEAIVRGTKGTLPRLVCELLAQTGVTEVDQIRRFLKPTVAEFHDPMTMKGVPEIVDLLLAAREAGEVVLVHGDYDADGVCSTALYTRCLKNWGWKIMPFVPHRLIDGYGVATRAVAERVADGVKVLLTCDTGTAADEAIRKVVEEHGVKVLVTDHHLPPADEKLPPADVIVNPHMPDCPYPDKNLCGAGVAFKVLQALATRLGLDLDEELFPYLDLVAFATIADVVPLIGENRAIAIFGLRRMRASRVPGLRALISDAKVKPPIRGTDIGMILAPRVNAIGRIGDAAVALNLMLTDNEVEAAELASTLSRTNVERQAMTRTLELAAYEQVDADPKRDERYGHIVYLPDGHVGIVGIVAGRVVERYGCPAFVFGYDAEKKRWTGSGRAPNRGKIHLKDALDTIADAYLKKHGGHAFAAGATLKDELDEAGREAFRDAFDAAVRAQMKPEDRIPEVRVNRIVSLSEMTDDVADYVRRFEPFDRDNNPSIHFMVKGVTLRSRREMTNGVHLKWGVEHDGVRMQAVAWRMGSERPGLKEIELPAKADIVFELTHNEWNGNVELQLVVKYLRLAGDPVEMATGMAEDRPDRAAAPRRPRSADGCSSSRAVPAGGVPPERLFA